MMERAEIECNNCFDLMEEAACSCYDCDACLCDVCKDAFGITTPKLALPENAVGSPDTMICPFCLILKEGS